MFGPWLEIFAWLKALAPNFKGFRRPHFQFITLHCTHAYNLRLVSGSNLVLADIYLISLTILGSIILYGDGSVLGYTDALFFASGCATQSGLNTYAPSVSSSTLVLTLAG